MAATFTSLQETFRKVGEQRAAEVLQGQAYNHLKVREGWGRERKGGASWGTWSLTTPLPPLLSAQIKEHINSICDAVLVDLRELCPVSVEREAAHAFNGP